MSLNIGIVGATGYVGEELASIVESREDLSLAFVSSFSHEGKEYKEVYSKTNSKLVLQPIDQMPDNLDYVFFATKHDYSCLLYTSPSPRDISGSRMPSSA